MSVYEKSMEQGLNLEMTQGSVLLFNVFRNECLDLKFNGPSKLDPILSLDSQVAPHSTGGSAGALHAGCSNQGIEAITIGGRVCSIGVVVNASRH